MGKLRIEQYFQVQDYALLDVIENGNSFNIVSRTIGNADGTSTSIIPAIQVRFCNNDATKKTQKTLLKQMYENFNAPSTESLDSIFNRLQKIISQLAILDLDIMSIDDLYNNFKIVEQEVKRTVTTSSRSGSQNMAFLSSPGSFNEVDTANIQVSAVSTPVSTVSTHDNIANLSDATVFKMAVRFVEHESKKPRHFAGEYRSHRNQERRPRNHDNSRKTMNVEDTSSKAMVAIDGAGFDWSHMADDEVPTNVALMAFSDSEEFQHPEFEGYGPKASKSVFVDTSNEIKKAPDALIIKDWVPDCDKDEYKVMVLKSDNVQHKPEQANQPKKVSQNPGENRTKWNVMKTQKLGVRTFAPTVVLNKYEIVPISTARQSSARAAAPGNRVTSAVRKQEINVVKSSACWVWRPKIKGDPQDALKDIGIFDSRCSRHMTGNKSYLTDYQEHNGGFVAFAMCDKKNSVLFIETECLILSPDFKLLDESQAINDESNSWHRRLGHINFKTMNKLVKGNLVRDTILNTLDHLGKFDRKADKGILVGYSINSKAFRVYNNKTRKVEENLHLNFFENKPNVTRSGPEWLFDIDSLTNSMNYQPVIAGNRTNANAGSEINSDTGQAGKEKVPNQEYILLPLLNTCSNVPLSYEEAEFSPKDDAGKKSTTQPTCIEGVNAASSSFCHPDALEDYSKLTNLEDTSIFNDAYDDRDEGAETDYNNLKTVISVSHIPSTRVHKAHPKEKIIGEIHSAVQTKKMAKHNEAGLLTFINKQRRTNHKDFQNCLFACFLSQMEPTKDKYVRDILKKFGFSSVKTASTPMETHKPLSKDENVKRIFRYLKGQLTLGLWYPKDSPLELIASFNSDYAGLELKRYLIKDGYADLVKMLMTLLILLVFLITLIKPHTSHQSLMANLEFYDKHNMVAFFKKPQGSDGFQQIVDFLNASHIRYALTENPTIYVSHINQLWHTASTRTLDNEEIELNGIVDGHNRTITEVSVRRHLKLVDDKGISTLPTTEIFSQLALIWGFSGMETTLFPTMLVNERIFKSEGPTSPVGTQHTPTVIVTSPQLQNISTTYRKTRTRTRRMGIRIPQSNVPNNVVDEAVTKEMHDGLGRGTTTDFSLEAEHGSGNNSKTQTKATPSGPSSPRTSTEGGPACHFTMGDSPVQARSERVSNLPNEPLLGEGNTSRSGEGSMQLLELIDICTTLSNRVTTLENKLSSTKAIYHKAFITLTKRVKKLETQLKQKRSRAVIHSSNEERPKVIKRSGFHLQQESSKKQKLVRKTEEEVKAPVDSDQEVEEMILYMRIVPDEEIAIDVIPLATKPPVIVKHKIVKEGKISTYHIIRADGSTKRYTSMINLLENIDRKDLETLWKLVKGKHENTRPEEGYERVL
uniref:Uncharacterized protein n=1 Tax=Tanacetum cinerariifolium TaxID=118510 RepID=A0A6L2N239_TANCI|nr:hypothetical protein [Tanacetum cinerariifolium]